MKLFINYRREDTDDLAGRLYDRLSAEFGSENIFKDVDSIRPGQNWKAVLEESVAGYDIVVALIGKQWITCVDQKGRQRISNEDDWVRCELEAANRHHRLIIPVMVKSAPVPRLDQLPESLRWLPETQVTEVRSDPFFKDDVARLISDLRGMRDRLAEQARLVQRAPVMPGAGSDAGAGAIVCPRCKRLSPRTDQFCEGCGAGLWDMCPKCNTPVPAGQRFCKSCGTDIPKLKQATDAYEAAPARFNELASERDDARRLQRADQVLNELEAAIRLAPDHAPLAALRRQLQELACDAAEHAAETEFAANGFGKALHFYQRLAGLGGATHETTARVEFIQKQREKRLRETTALLAQGGYKQAAAMLAPLQVAFPEDAQIKEMHDKCQQVLERASRLLSQGIRELRAQRRLMELEREICWLQAQRIRVDKLPEVAEVVRKRIANANATITKAFSDLRAGNAKAAGRLARSVLEVVADHAGAQEIMRSTGGLVERVAQLEELVRLKQWCAASEFVRELEDIQLADTRAAKLIIRTKAAMASINFSVWLLLVLLAILMAAGMVGVPLLASKIDPPGGWDRKFFYLIWAVGSFLLLSITWLASDNKS